MTRRSFLAAAALAPLARLLPWLSSWRGHEPFRPIDKGPEPWSKDFHYHENRPFASIGDHAASRYERVNGLPQDCASPWCREASLSTRRGLLVQQ